MPSVSELVEDVAEVMGADVATVSAYARSLINAGELPKSRGRSIARVTHRDITKLLIAVALMPRIKSTASVVSDYMGLRLESVGDPQVQDDEMTAGDWLEDMFGRILNNPPHGDEAPQISLLRTASVVLRSEEPEIEWRLGDGGMSVRFGAKASAPTEGFCKRMVEVSFQGIGSLGAGSGRTYQEGEVV